MDLNTYAPGRPPKPETMTEMQKMVKVIKAEPGIRSAKLAQKLGMTSLRCAMLGRRLAKQGKIVIERQPDRALAYRLA
jgi:hypothetical protein